MVVDVQKEAPYFAISWTSNKVRRRIVSFETAEALTESGADRSGEGTLQGVLRIAVYLYSIAAIGILVRPIHYRLNAKRIYLSLDLRKSLLDLL